MSTSKNQRAIEKMSPNERFFAASYLTVLLPRDDPEYRAMLAERMTRVEDRANIRSTNFFRSLGSERIVSPQP